MATIQKREGSNGPSYRVLVRHRGHAAETRTFRKLADARAFAAKAETAINEGAGSTLREAKKRTVGEAIKRYVDSVIAARDDKSTARHYAYWTLRLGHMRLATITADVIAVARDDLFTKVTRLGKPRAPATVKLYLESFERRLQGVPQGIPLDAIQPGPGRDHAETAQGPHPLPERRRAGQAAR